jgi:hypothetical protein
MAGRIWVIDREAYTERRAIMEVEGVESLEASRVASVCGYRTQLSEVATEAANGDWEPAREWIAETALRYGQSTADELVSEIDANIEAAMVWRR